MIEESRKSLDCRGRAGDSFVMKLGYVGAWRTIETLRNLRHGHLKNSDVQEQATVSSQQPTCTRIRTAFVQTAQVTDVFSRTISGRDEQSIHTMRRLVAGCLVRPTQMLIPRHRLQRDRLSPSFRQTARRRPFHLA